MPSHEDQQATEEGHKWNGQANQPERPDRQESVGIGEKPLLDVTNGTLLNKYPVYTGHEENQAEHRPGERNRADVFRLSSVSSRRVPLVRRVESAA